MRCGDFARQASMRAVSRSVSVRLHSIWRMLSMLRRAVRRCSDARVLLLPRTRRGAAILPRCERRSRHTSLRPPTRSGTPAQRGGAAAASRHMLRCASASASAVRVMSTAAARALRGLCAATPLMYLCSIPRRLRDAPRGMVKHDGDCYAALPSTFWFATFAECLPLLSILMLV